MKTIKKKVRLGKTKLEITLSNDDTIKSCWLKRFNKKQLTRYLIVKEKFTNNIFIYDKDLSGKEYLSIMTKIILDLITKGEINSKNINKLKDFMFDLWGLKYFSYIE